MPVDELAARRELRAHVEEFWRACACSDCRARFNAELHAEAERRDVWLRGLTSGCAA